MDDNTGRLTRLALLCGQCNCGCPELLVDHEAPLEQRIVITDDFGQRVQMSEDQLLVLIEEARSGRLGAALSGLASQFSPAGATPRSIWYPPASSRAALTASSASGLSLATMTRELPPDTRSTVTAETPPRPLSSLVTAFTQCSQLIPVTT